MMRSGPVSSEANGMVSRYRNNDNQRSREEEEEIERSMR